MGPKSGCRNVVAESMLASHAALCLFTGSFEMLVFHTLSAGNIGQLGAPGTVAVMTGLPLALAIVVAVRPQVRCAFEGRVPARPAGRSALTDARSAVAGAVLAVAAPQPATEMASIAPAANRRTRRSTKCPVSMRTVPSWHGRRGSKW